MPRFIFARLSVFLRLIRPLVTLIRFIYAIIRRVLIGTPPLFSRAKPKEVQQKEEYSYLVELPGRLPIKKEGDPKGSVKVVLPYDGEKFFNHLSLRDIKHQNPYVWKLDQQETKIGHLGFTNVDRALSIPKSEDGEAGDIPYLLYQKDEPLPLIEYENSLILPLNIPLKDETLQKPEALLHGCHAYNGTYDYKPGAMPAPFTFEVEIRDERLVAALVKEEVEKEDRVEEESETDTEAKKVEAKEEKSEKKSDGDVEKSSDEIIHLANEVKQNSGFERGLIFEFKITLSLPESLDLSENPAKIKNISLRWPTIPSNRSVYLLKGAEQVPVKYSPGKKEISLGMIPFDRPPIKHEEFKRHLYQTEPILLSVEQPSELYHIPQLEGEMQIEIPTTLCGLNVAYFGAVGRQMTVDVKSSTTLKAKLKLNLEASFRQKMLSPYQHLEFEGVAVDEMRIADILSLLKEQGFHQSESTPLVTSSSSRSRHQTDYLITAKRTEGLGELSLWMLVKGANFQGARQQILAPGQSFMTRLDTGHMSICLRGQLRRDNKRIVGVMNEIQKQLKERFRYVRTVE